jgi:hypothetical protein
VVARTMLTLRVEQEVLDNVPALQTALGARDRSDALRQALEVGFSTVLSRQEDPVPEPQALPRDVFAQHIAAHMNALSAVLDQQKTQDPVGAVLAARGVESAARGWADARAATVGVGLSGEERVAQLVDSLVVLVRSAPEPDRLPLWQAVLGAVTARSREDYADLTGDTTPDA